MSVVADGTYRLQNLTDNGGSDYFTLKTGGQIQSAPLDANSDCQKWKITKRSDGHYDIANTGTGALLAVASPSGGETAYTLSVTGDNTTTWDFDDRFGSKLVIKPTQFPGKAVDLSAANRVILWDDNSLPNQRWILDFIAPPPPVVQPTWVAVQGTNFPANTVIGGHEDDEPTLFIARGPINGALHPGKAGRQLPGICRVVWGATEVPITTYEVLTASPGSYKWVALPDGTGSKIDLSKIPKLIVAGNNPTVGTLYVIRAPIGTALIPGVAYTTGFSVGLNGKSVSPDTGREVLCYAD